jgi:hypothetical protein
MVVTMDLQRLHACVAAVHRQVPRDTPAAELLADAVRLCEVAAVRVAATVNDLSVRIALIQVVDLLESAASAGAPTRPLANAANDLLRRVTGLAA